MFGSFFLHFACPVQKLNPSWVAFASTKQFIRIVLTMLTSHGVSCLVFKEQSTLNRVFLLLSQPGIIVYHKALAMSIVLFLEKSHCLTNTAPQSDFIIISHFTGLVKYKFFLKFKVNPCANLLLLWQINSPAEHQIQFLHRFALHDLDEPQPLHKLQARLP